MTREISIKGNQENLKIRTELERKDLIEVNNAEDEKKRK